MYFLIGISLFFSILLPINIVLTALVSAIWKLVGPLISNRRAGTRAAFAFALKVLPTAISLLLLFAFVLPSFVLYEPANSDESVGLKLDIVIAIAMFGMLSATFRIFGSWWRTRRIISGWTRESDRGEDLAGSIPVLRLRHPFPVFAIVGVRRPRIFIAEQLFNGLTTEELHAVVSHELGHVHSLDNLKRLVMRFCSDLLILPIGKSLDNFWSETSELAADEYAVQKDGKPSALLLASALIKIARLIPEEPLPAIPAASFALEQNGQILARRIGNLVAMSENMPVGKGSSSTPLVASLAFLTLIVVYLATDTAFLSRIHAISESILSVLQ